MAEPPILYLKNSSIGFGSAPLFTNVDLQISPGEKICLIGRNGTGKSTLFKIIEGLQELDSGEIYRKPGIKIGYLKQDSSFENFDTVYDLALSSISKNNAGSDHK